MTAAYSHVSKKYLVAIKALNFMMGSSDLLAKIWIKRLTHS